jgi:two-component system, OmpR family, sensor histidine kinase VicK
MPLSQELRSKNERKAPAAHLTPELLAAIWETATDAIALSDPDGRVRLANPAYYELFGRSPEEVLGHSFALIFPPEQRAWAEETYRATFHDMVPSDRVESRVRRSDGAELTVEADYHFLTENGRRTAMISMVRDMTERNRLEQSRRDILAMIVHDLRTPLTAIAGYAQMLRRRGGSDQGMVDTILQKCDLMKHLISDLADAARPEGHVLTLERTEVDLRELARRVAAEMEDLTHGHPIRVDAPSVSSVGCWDRTRLEQILENLLSNALKYSPAGGEIVVQIEHRASDVRVSVRDQGLGIPSDRLESIFDRFYRVEDNATGAIDGWGLGLSITKRLVEAHGGRIWAESAGVGQGCSVSFTLPH